MTVFEVTVQFIKRKEIKPPNKVKKKGIFFKATGENSASKIKRFSKFVVIDVKKEEVPIPIKKSLLK